MINKDIGLSKFVISVLSGFLVGLYISNYFPINFYWLLIIAIIFVTFLIIFWQKNYYRLIAIGLIALIIGAAYLSFWEYKENKKHLEYDQDLIISSVQIETLPKIDGNKQIIIVSYNKKKFKLAFLDILNINMVIYWK